MAECTRRILVVDDNPDIHADFRKILCERWPTLSSLDEQERVLFGTPSSEAPVQGFQVDSAFQGEEGLAKVRAAREEGRPYQLAFVDVRMPPGCDGVETAQHILNEDDEIQLVLCTAYSDYRTVDLLELFGSSDRLLALKKPFDIVEASLLAVALVEKWELTRETAKLVRTQTEYIVDVDRVVDVIRQCNEELENTNVDLETRSTDLSRKLQQRSIELLGMQDVTVFALAKLAESRDRETGEHLERLRSYAQLLAEHLAKDPAYADEIDDEFLQNFYRATPLHDIGKVGIPDEILLKPGALTPSEFEIMKRHTLIGAEALEKAAHHTRYAMFLGMAAEIARSHHERYDGSGYPVGLRGDQIPISARIVAVADVFDALTSKRVYKDAMNPDEARLIIERDAGTHFDPAVVDAFHVCYESFLQIKAAVDDDVSNIETSSTEPAAAPAPLSHGVTGD